MVRNIKDAVEPKETEIVSEYRELGYNCIVVWANNEEDIIFEWPNIVRQIDSIGV